MNALDATFVNASFGVQGLISRMCVQGVGFVRFQGCVEGAHQIIIESFANNG